MRKHKRKSYNKLTYRNNDGTIEIGQVLTLVIRYDNKGTIADKKHPYLVVGKKNNRIEVAQLDSLKGKEYKSARPDVVTIYAKGESVVDKDSYVNLSTLYYLEDYNDIVAYRRQKDTLSCGVLYSVLDSYYKYHEENSIVDSRQVYMTKEELEYYQISYESEHNVEEEQIEV